MSSYHYQYGVDSGCSWRVFFTRMLVFNVLAIMLILAGSKFYNNQMAHRDAATVKSWCQQVLCVYIDPATGIGYPAVPEVVPEQLTVPADMEVHEI